MIKFTQQVKDDWVAALRSGQYQQAHHWMRKGDRYCCLGVLKDMHPAMGVNSSAKYCTYMSNEGEATLVEGLPVSVQHDLALMNDYSIETTDPQTGRTTSDYQNSFEDIALFIEATIPAGE